MTMTANELKYTYMEEAMSILDNEELMRKALSLLRNLKEDLLACQAKRAGGAGRGFPERKRLEGGKNNLSPIGGSIE